MKYKRNKQSLLETSLSTIVSMVSESGEENLTIGSFVDKYGEQKIVNFIYNRHCSRFDPATSDIDTALNRAWDYHTEEETILDDLRTVESYGDLDQYFRL